MLGEGWESGDVKAELSCLGEFAYLCVSLAPLLRTKKVVPKQVPRDSSLSLDIEVARFARESRT